MRGWRVGWRRVGGASNGSSCEVSGGVGRRRIGRRDVEVSEIDQRMVEGMVEGMVERIVERMVEGTDEMWNERKTKVRLVD